MHENDKKKYHKHGNQKSAKIISSTLLMDAPSVLCQSKVDQQQSLSRGDVSENFYGGHEKRLSHRAERGNGRTAALAPSRDFSAQYSG